MWKDFKAFLLKQNALALAIAFIIGGAMNRVVQAIVNDVIMPIVTFMVPNGDWEKAKWAVGSVQFGVGDLASALLNFVIIGFVAWRLAKLVPAEVPPATKDCKYCFSKIDPRASRCPQCGSEQ